MSPAERSRLRLRHWREELGRAIDYLATCEDIDAPPDSQWRQFELLGSPTDQKGLVVFESGHGNLPRFQVERETLDWFERHLGAVKR